MKKRISIVICVLLACMLSLSTACSMKPNMAKLFKTVETTKEVKTLSAIGNKDVIIGVDQYGLAIVKTVIEESVYNDYTGRYEPKQVADKYRLYDVKAGSFINGAETRVERNVNTENMAAYTKKLSMRALTAGMYVIPSKSYTRQSPDEAFDCKSVTFAVYGRGGKVADVTFDYVEDYTSSEFGAYNPFKDGKLTDSNGTRYYVNGEGDVVQEGGLFDLVCSEEIELEDFYVDLNGRSLFVFEKEDMSFVRTVDMNAFDIPAGAEDGESWFIGNTLYSQYIVELPEDAEEYSFFENGRKYNLLTLSYNVKSDKAKEIDFDYVVDYAYGYSALNKDDCILLDVVDVKDGYLVGDCYVQCFDKNCKVDTDLQSILPGANDVEIIGEYVYLSSDSQTVILKEKEVVNTIYSSDFTQVGNLAYVMPTDSRIDIYDLTNGSKVKSYSNVINFLKIKDCVVLKLDNSVVLFNFSTQEEKHLVSNYNKDETRVSLSGYGVQVTHRGADGNFGTTDDNNSFIFYNGRNKEEWTGRSENVTISGVGSFYYNDGDSSHTNVSVVMIAKTTYDLEFNATVTYSYYMDVETTAYVTED